MIFRRLFGTEATSDANPPVPGPVDASVGETDTVRRIVASLEAMPAEQARYLAGFAYILSRAAEADMDISAAETSAMERLVVEFGGLSEAQAVIVVEIAKTQARLLGGTEDFLVTREFTRLTSDEQRLAVIRCCFVVAAGDSISAAESAVLSEIANELNISQPQLAALRGEFTERFAAVQAMRAQLAR